MSAKVFWFIKCAAFVLIAIIHISLTRDVTLFTDPSLLLMYLLVFYGAAIANLKKNFLNRTQIKENH